MCKACVYLPALCLLASIATAQTERPDPRTTQRPEHRADEARAVVARFLAEWGEEGAEPGEFHFPIGIAINAADEIFVTDFYNDRVQKFSTDGKLLCQRALKPSHRGALENQPF